MKSITQVKVKDAKLRQLLTILTEDAAPRAIAKKQYVTLTKTIGWLAVLWPEERDAINEILQKRADGYKRVKRPVLDGASAFSTTISNVARRMKGGDCPGCPSQDVLNTLNAASEKIMTDEHEDEPRETSADHAKKDPPKEVKIEDKKEAKPKKESLQEVHEFKLPVEKWKIPKSAKDVRAKFGNPTDEELKRVLIQEMSMQQHKYNERNTSTTGIIREYLNFYKKMVKEAGQRK